MSRAVRRVLSILTGAVCALTLVAGLAAPAEAHAIIEVSANAYTGRTSALTIEIQHGCMGGDDTGPTSATNKVSVYFSPAFGTVVPRSVPGWRASVTRIWKGTQRVTWTATGAAVPFSTPFYLKFSVTWPKRPAAYGIPVFQYCSTAVVKWYTPVRPATAGVPSPPLTPLPEIAVLCPGQRALGDGRRTC